MSDIETDVFRDTGRPERAYQPAAPGTFPRAAARQAVEPPHVFAPTPPSGVFGAQTELARQRDGLQAEVARLAEEHRALTERLRGKKAELEQVTRAVAHLERVQNPTRRRSTPAAPAKEEKHR